MFLGHFNTLSAVWKAIPEGGREGDSITLNGVTLYWNKYKSRWGEESNLSAIEQEHFTHHGDITIRGKLTVTGDIDANGLNQPNCGLYPTIEALKKAHPTPSVGQWAVIGANMPGRIWRCDARGVWTDTGVDGGTDTLHLEEYVKKNADGSTDKFFNERGEAVTLSIPEAPVQSVSVNGKKVEPDTAGNVNIETKQGTVQSVTLNGAKHTPDTDGNVVLALEEVQVDATLNVESNNAVSNQAVATRLAEIDASVAVAIDSEVREDEGKVIVSLLDKSGTPISQTEFTGGSGGGSGNETATTRIVLTSSVDNPQIKVGGKSTLTYHYDHQYTAGDDKGVSTGQRATIQISIRQGATIVHEQTASGISAGTYTLDLTPYLRLGTTDIYVRAVVESIEEGGKTQSRQSYISVRAYDLTLRTSYSIAQNLSGYSANEVVSIPYSIEGIGNKTVLLYIDGVEKDSQTVTKSGTTNGTFHLPLTTYERGRHTVQLVARLEISPELTIRSRSIAFDIYKRQSAVPHIATLIYREDGDIRTTDHLLPTITAEQYEQATFTFAVYDPDATPTSVEVYEGNALMQTISAQRTLQAYTNRFRMAGAIDIQLQCKEVQYPLRAYVTPSSVDVEDITDGRVLHLSAAGRSNAEAYPDVWRSGEVKAVFNGFDWKGSGWTGDALRIINGASVEIPYPLFATDATAEGRTIEIEIAADSIVNANLPLCTCVDANGTGITILPQEVRMRTVEGKEVSRKFASEERFRVSFVIRKKTEKRLLEIFIDGERSGAERYASTDSLIHSTPVTILLNSRGANISVNEMRVYDRALSDDEVLANYTATRPTTTDIMQTYTRNQVLGDDGKVSMERLRTMGKSVMLIEGDIALLVETNNKKFEIPVDITFYSAFGKQYDFNLKNAGLRLQGTSSMTYPRKNFRPYMDSKFQNNKELTVGGVLQSLLKYSFKPGAKAVDLHTLKSDYMDSSGTHNTGAARLINDMFIECGWLTPPQAYEKEHKGKVEVRTGIDGFPIDLFVRQSGTDEIVYFGKYNFNNDKSKSAVVFGFEDIEGFNDAATLQGAENKCICLEFLDNSTPLGNFQTADMSTFDEALEFRFPEDVTWNTATSYQKNAVQRLWTWINSCKNNPTKFAQEVSQYFDVNNLCAWYIFTDYLMMVDQRVKNMMLGTWNGLEWYFLPYDNDTIFSKRNDGHLKYDYTLTEETYDAEVGAYAFAGHDSVLWKLVREALPDKLAEVAQTLRNKMTNKKVLQYFDEDQMKNWSERIYNKDGEFKYINPLLESGRDYLFALQGSQKTHRRYIIQNRFALLDAKYLAGTYRADNINVYFVHQFSKDQRNIDITASAPYYFGYGSNNKAPHQSGVMAKEAGDKVQLTLNRDLIMNDPQSIYGASRIRVLDLRNVARYITNNLPLSKCATLEKLYLYHEENGHVITQTMLTGVDVSRCLALSHIYVKGMQGMTTLDLTNNKRLEVVDGEGAGVVSMSLPEGAPLRSIKGFERLQSLKLVGLPQLANAGIEIRGERITSLWIEACPHIDWSALLAKFAATTHLRIVGIDKEGDSAWLNQFMDKGGITAEGSLTDTCALVGTYQLTKYLSDEELARYQSKFPELTIKQPEYSELRTYDAYNGTPVLTAFNVYNPDNNTGFSTTSAFILSGHFERYWRNRHRYLGDKVGDEMQIKQLHDKNSYYYADATDIKNATPAKLDGTEGDIWVREPRCWYKGVTDIVNGVNYAFLSMNVERPKDPEGKLIHYTEMVAQGMVMGSRYLALAEKGAHIDSAITTHSNHDYYRIDVEGWKRVNFPAYPIEGFNAASNPKVYAYFTDASGVIIQRVEYSNQKYNALTHDIRLIPDGAKYLYVSMYKGIMWEGESVWLTNSDRPADWEYGWEEHKETLVTPTWISFKTDKFRSITGTEATVTALPRTMSEETLEKQGWTRLRFSEASWITMLTYLCTGSRGMNYTEDYYGGRNSHNAPTVLTANETSILYKYGMTRSYAGSTNAFGASTAIKTTNELNETEVFYTHWQLNWGYLDFLRGFFRLFAETELGGSAVSTTVKDTYTGRRYISQYADVQAVATIIFGRYFNWAKRGEAVGTTSSFYGATARRAQTNYILRAEEKFSVQVTSKSFSEETYIQAQYTGKIKIIE